jgi:hypothetical protein
MGKHVPTLSSLGWVSTVEQKGDFALSYFITSEYSQSVLYQGNIESLQYLVKMYASDPLKLEEEISNSLEGLMTRYFGESATARVDVQDPDPDRPQELTIRFWCIVRENEREYSLGRSVLLTDSRIAKIAKLNNG